VASVINPKTADDYLSDMQGAVVDQSEVVADTTSGALVDVIFGPVASIAELANADVREVEGLITLDNPENYTADELAGSLARDGVTIATNGRATGYVVFWRKTAVPTGGATPETIQRGFPIGTAPDASSGQAVTAYTTESRSWSQSSFVAARARYELSVAVTVTASGTRGNQAPNRLTRPLRTLPTGWEGVTNVEKLGGGTDVETNTRAAGRAALSVRGSQKSTPSGIKKLVLDSLSDISSVRVIYGADERLTRAASKANAVDVWVKTTSTASVTETLAYAGLGVKHVLSRQPVVSISTVVIGGVAYTAASDWELTADDGLEFGSIRALDGVTVNNTTPAAGDAMVVTYSTNTTVRAAQAIINGEDVESLGADVLIRAATPVDIYLAARLRPLTGVSFATVSALVRAEILDLVNNQRALADAIELFDITSAVDDDDIAGVDNFSIDRLARDAADSTAADRDIDVSEYARLEEANLIITEL